MFKTFTLIKYRQLKKCLILLGSKTQNNQVSFCNNRIEVLFNRNKLKVKKALLLKDLITKEAQIKLKLIEAVIVK